MLKHIIKKYIPKSVKERIKALEQKKIQREVSSLPLLKEDELYKILKEDVGITAGDVVFVQSSVNYLNLDFPFYNIISILRDILGKEGTFLFPTYPKLTSYKFLKSGSVFDVKKTPSYTGLLNEFARRQKDSIRSLHPTKSVAAIGANAYELTRTHKDSPYPYDKCSPYYRITEFNGKIIGIGVDNSFISAVHCADDILKDDFPVQPYHKELFEAKCINYNGEVEVVRTYAHDMDKMNFKLTKFFDKYITKDICRNVHYKGMKFYRADAKPLIDNIVDLAKNKITIYPRIYYK